MLKSGSGSACSGTRTGSANPARCSAAASTALGAFVAGVMLADSPYRHELEADVEPFRSILLGLFFLSVGMLLNLGAIAHRPGWVFGMALLAGRRAGKRRPSSII